MFLYLLGGNKEICLFNNDMLKKIYRFPWCQRCTDIIIQDSSLYIYIFGKFSSSYLVQKCLKCMLDKKKVRPRTQAVK